MIWQKIEPITINNTIFTQHYTHTTKYRAARIPTETMVDMQVLPGTLKEPFMLFRYKSCDKLYSNLIQERGKEYKSATTSN